MHTMKQLKADIKNGIYKKIYLLYGADSYNRKRYADALVKVFLPNDDGINLTRFYGNKVDLKELVSLSETMPFLAERRVICLENSGLFSSSCEELSELIPGIPETTVIIFSEEKADARLKQFKDVKKEGCAAEFKKPTDADIRDWVTKKIGREHRRITKDALDLFLLRCGSDMWQVEAELEKVISYTFGKEGIHAEDVDAVIPATAEDKIFVMIDAILARDLPNVLKLYKDLLLLRSEPSRILGLLRDQFRLMLHIKEMSGSGMKAEDIADILEVKEGRVKMTLPSARKSSKISLTGSMEMCADTVRRINTGLIDEKIAVESLMIELCMKD